MHATLQPTRERESLCEPSRSQTYRAVHILGLTIRSGQQTNEYSYILQINISSLHTARTITPWSTQRSYSPRTADHCDVCQDSMLTKKCPKERCGWVGPQSSAEAH